MTAVIAQSLGIIGAGFNIGSFQLKSNKKLILCQFLGSSFFLFNYLLLGGYTGCIMNGLGVARNLVFSAGGIHMGRLSVTITPYRHDCGNDCNVFEQWENNKNCSAVCKFTMLACI